MTRALLVLACAGCYDLDALSRDFRGGADAAANRDLAERPDGAVAVDGPRPDMARVLRFGPGQLRATTGASPRFLFPGDLNADGNLDLLSADAEDLNNGGTNIFIGAADGSFAAPIRIKNTGRALAVTNLNGDRPDLVVPNFFGCLDQMTFANCPVSLYADYQGAGIFLFSTASTVSGQPSWVEIADFDGDGHPDGAFALYHDGALAIARGNGTVDFPVVEYWPINGTRPAALAVADFDGDGRKDVALANEGSNDVTLQRNQPNNAFNTTLVYPVGGSPSHLVAADFNDDGKVDLAVAIPGAGGVRILINDGGGGVEETKLNLVGTQPIALAAADFDGDGHIDLVVADAGEPAAHVLINLGGGTFAPGPELTDLGGGHSFGAAVGDFNHDALPDVAVTVRGPTNGVAIFLQQK